MLFPQPQEKYIDEPVERLDQPCAACGETEMHRYRLADYRGWLVVEKCRACLTMATSERIPAPAQAT